MKRFFAAVFFAILAAPGSAAVSSAGPARAPAPHAQGQSIASAVRSLTLRHWDFILPRGISREEAAALPPDSSFWTQMLKPPLPSNELPEIVDEHFDAVEMLQRRLRSIVRSAHQYSADRSYSVGTEAVPDGVDSHSDLEKILAMHAAAADAMRAHARRFTEPLAAQSVAPEVVVEQYLRNRVKPRGRNLEFYDQRVGGKQLHPLAGFPASQRLLTLKNGRPIAAILADQSRRHAIVRVADVGGGHGLAISQMDSPTVASILQKSLVDVFDWERLAPGLRVFGEAGSRPANIRLYLSDATDVRFPPGERQHLITMIESFWYVHDKLAAISNLYNQLADDGLLVIASKSPWNPLLRSSGKYWGTIFFESILHELNWAGVHALTLTPSRGSSLVSALWIQRRPGTSMSLRTRLQRTSILHNGFSTSWYDSAHYQTGAVEIVGP